MVNHTIQEAQNYFYKLYSQSWAKTMSQNWEGERGDPNQKLRGTYTGGWNYEARMLCMWGTWGEEIPMVINNTTKKSKSQPAPYPNPSIIKIPSQETREKIPGQIKGNIMWWQREVWIKRQSNEWHLLSSPKRELWIKCQKVGLALDFSYISRKLWNRDHYPNQSKNPQLPKLGVPNHEYPDFPTKKLPNNLQFLL